MSHIASHEAVGNPVLSVCPRCRISPRSFIGNVAKGS